MYNSEIAQFMRLTNSVPGAPFARLIFIRFRSIFLPRTPTQKVALIFIPATTDVPIISVKLCMKIIYIKSEFVPMTFDRLLNSLYSLRSLAVPFL